MKSDLPVPTIKAPTFLASSGIISGTGLAIAKIKFFSVILAAHSGLRAPAAETPMKMSAPSMTFSKSPYSLLGLVKLAIYSFCAFILLGLPL